MVSHAVYLGVTVLQDKVGHEFDHEREPFIDGRLRKEPVHQGQTASAAAGKGGSRHLTRPARYLSI